MTDIEDDSIKLAICLSEAKKIKAICNRYFYRGLRDRTNMTKIEVAAEKIINTCTQI